MPGERKSKYFDFLDHPNLGARIIRIGASLKHQEFTTVVRGKKGKFQIKWKLKLSCPLTTGVMNHPQFLLNNSNALRPKAIIMTSNPPFSKFLNLNRAAFTSPSPEIIKMNIFPSCHWNIYAVNFHLLIHKHN